jgi:hypothetical protein
MSRPELLLGFNLKMKIRTVAWLCSSAGTIADKELQPKLPTSAPLAAVALRLLLQTGKDITLCPV